VIWVIVCDLLEKNGVVLLDYRVLYLSNESLVLLERRKVRGMTVFLKEKA